MKSCRADWLDFNGEAADVPAVVKALTVVYQMWTILLHYLEKRRVGLKMSVPSVPFSFRCEDSIEVHLLLSSGQLLVPHLKFLRFVASFRRLLLRF